MNRGRIRFFNQRTWLPVATGRLRKSSSAVPVLFRGQDPTSTRPTLPEDRPLSKPLIQARRAKQSSSASKESSPSLDQRMGAV